MPIVSIFFGIIIRMFHREHFAFQQRPGQHRFEQQAQQQGRDNPCAHITHIAQPHYASLQCETCYHNISCTTNPREGS